MKWLFLCVIFSQALPVFGQDKYEELIKRIEELETQQEELLVQNAERQQSQVTSFLNNQISFGGFFEAGYVIQSGPDTELEATNVSNILGLNIASEYKNNLRFVSQILTGYTYPQLNRDNNPRVQPSSRESGPGFFGALLSQGYLEYRWGSDYVIQGGVGYVPFGYAHQQRELVLFIRRGGPQLLRTNDMVAPTWSGLNFLANHQLTNSSWGYNFYSFNPPSSPGKPGIGARTFWSSSQERFTAGLSTQVGKIGTNNFQTLGTDFRINEAPFILVAEFIHGFYADGDRDPWSAYIEPAVYILDQELLLYVFGDYSFNARNKSVGTSPIIDDPIQKYEYGFGVNWLPTSYTRIRAGLTLHEYVGQTAVVDNQERDFTSLDLSVGVAF